MIDSKWFSSCTKCLALALICLIGSVASVAAQPVTVEQSVRPNVNEKYLDANLKVEDWIARFEIESREVFASREEVLDALELRPDMAVADVGAGTGLYTTLMGQRLMNSQTGPTGWVYAVDIAPRFVEHLGGLARKNRLGNITPVLCAENSIRLPPQSVDLVFTCDVYHHFEYPSSTLASIRSALRSGGRLVVIDFERIPGESSDWVLGHVRADKETVRREIEAAGFELVEEKELEGLSENYFLIFRDRNNKLGNSSAK